MTARSGAPPGKRRGPAPTPGPSRIEVAATDTAGDIVDDPPRWSGFPMGCGGWHDHPPVPLHRCNHCTSLDIAARESLETCQPVCPFAGR
jgi:hypothetical protein